MKEYKNKNWLKKQYLDNKLSALQISQLCDTSLYYIYYWLDKFSIKRRTQGEINYLSYLNHLKDKKYSNKDWIQEQYIKNRLSTCQIGTLCNCSDETIRYWLTKHNIPIRSWSKAGHLARGNYCDLSEKAKQWIDGELLGDGCLHSQSKWSALFSYVSKYLEYINYISDTLKSFGIKQAGKINKYYYEKFDCYCYNYSSLCYSELLPIYKRWYPERKKIIPRDLKLTSLVLRQEHIGDGSLIHYKKGKPAILFSTDGFPKPDVKWLVGELNKLGFKSTRRPSDNSIRISTYSTKDFLQYIGNCPVKCYQYKFNY